VSGLTRPATRAELSWVAPAAVRSRLVEDGGELVAIHEAEPWRVRVTSRGEAVLLDRWRAHLGDCAVLGLWCSPRRVPLLVADLMAVARDLGFTRLLGPLVPEGSVGPYVDSGMRIVERVLVLRLDDLSRVRAQASAPDGVTARPASLEDLPALVGLDGACFEPFWHYDLRLLTRLAREDRVVLAEKDGAPIGYTLAAVRGVDGSLGRLAVVPSMRRRGIGRFLAAEAVAWMAERGARTVVLSTQEDNRPSRALYAGLGFRETPGVLVACASAPLSTGRPGV
jgi:ribosomal protein S18 acetylase RimI-like enzyme